MGGRGAQHPVLGGSEFKKTGARSARARTRGQNPLVVYICSAMLCLLPKYNAFHMECRDQGKGKLPEKDLSN